MKTTTNARIVGLLFAVSLVSSLHVSAQVQPLLAQSLLENRLPDEPKRKVDKIDFLYKASRIYLLEGTGLDAVTTAHALSQPNTVEENWAACFGKKNTGAVVLANGFLNLGVGLASRELYKHRGQSKILGIAAVGLSLFKATDSTVAGIHNIRQAERR